MIKFRTAASLGSAAMNIATLFFGYLLDRYGTFCSRTVATIVLTIGLFFLMFAEEVHAFMFIGIILYSSATFSFLVTNHPLSGLYPTIAGFILVLGQAVFQMSASFFRLWSFMFSSGVPFKKKCQKTIN